MPDGRLTPPWFAPAFSPVFGEKRRSHNAVIQIHNALRSVIQIHEHAGEFKEC
jgi:hypothetical protein